MDIPQGVTDLFNSITSDMISKNFGVPCTLIYGANRQECINCVYNTITKSSTGLFKTGGPLPFIGTVCPYCSGVGYKNIEVTETIKMRVYFNKKDFLRIELPITVTNSTIQTIAFITDLPKLQKAQEIIANSNLQNYSVYRYILAGEIIPYGGISPIKNFCIAYWNRN
jgi:hypothetical protein